MTINYGHEYRKFAREQKKQREYFRSVGMTEEAIAEIEAFDKEEFLRTLAYKRNTQPLETLNAFGKDDESNSPLFDKFSYELTVTIDTYKPPNRYGWKDEIENPLFIKENLQARKISIDKTLPNAYNKTVKNAFSALPTPKNLLPLSFPTKKRG